MKYAFPRVQKTTVPSERIPENINLESVVKQFKEPSYNMGVWSKTPEKIPTPTSDNFSHLIKDVDLSDGQLEVSFEFANTVRGMELMYQFDKMVMVPILDNEGINIVRFDFIEEK